MLPSSLQSYFMALWVIAICILFLNGPLHAFTCMCTEHLVILILIVTFIAVTPLGTREHMFGPLSTTKKIYLHFCEDNQEVFETKRTCRNWRCAIVTSRARFRNFTYVFIICSTWIVCSSMKYFL